METKEVVNNYAINQNEQKRRCYRCDSDKHLANVCRHKETICNQCSVKGHLAKVCRRSKQRNQVNVCSSSRRSANDVVKNKSMENSSDEDIHQHPGIVKMDVKLMRKKDTASTIRCLKHWFSIYGLPNQLVSDNGTQFTSNEFATYMKSTGINHMRVAAYHQSSNGQVERYVQIVKKGFKCNSTNNVEEKLEQLLTAHRSTPSTATNKTPSSLFLGRKMQVAIDIMKP